MIRRLRAAWHHPWLDLRVPFLLGALFVVAAWPKLVDPPAFAKLLHAYGLVPAGLVHAMALVLPWLEMAVGLALCAGILVRAAARWTAILLVVFMGALGWNLHRGHPVDCGCFTTQAAAPSRESRLQDMRWAILRDLGMLLLAAQILSRPSRNRAIPED